MNISLGSAPVYPSRFHGMFWNGIQTLGTWTRQINTAQAYNYHMTNTTTADSHKMTWKNVILAAGTYKISLMCVSRADGGIATVKLNGTAIATLDTYSAGTTNDVVVEATDIAITQGSYDIEVSNPTKNASSTSYRVYCTVIMFERTA